MSYKEGDVVLLYTWNELVGSYGERESGFLCNIAWNRYDDVHIPDNRIIHIDRISEWGHEDIQYYCEDDIIHIPLKVIKCSANEYYLQQIKEELCIRKETK